LLQPSNILDVESSNSIQSLSALQVMKGAYLILASSDRQQSVFLAKLGSKSQSKSKVKKADSVINLAIKQHQIMCSKIIDERSINTVQGTAFAM